MSDDLNPLQKNKFLRSFVSKWIENHRKITHDSRMKRTGHDDTDEINLLAWTNRYLNDYCVKPPSRMHKWLSRQLDDAITNRGTRLNVLAPRGAAKSTIGTFAYPLREALEGREAYIWIISDTMSQAHAHMENIKTEICENNKIARKYPHATGKGSIWRNGSIVLNNDVMIEAFGTGQKLRGRRRKQHRPTLIVCDDLQNDNHIISSYAREKTRSWFHGTLTKAGNVDTNILNLATALHGEAIALELTNKPGWTSRIFRAIENWPVNMTLWEQWELLYNRCDDPDSQKRADDFFVQHQDKMLQDAIVLWPEHEDLLTLMKIRVEGGRSTFEREKQNSPVNPDYCEWPESYFDETTWCDTIPSYENRSCSVISLDPSKGADSSRGDYSAFVMVSLGKDGIFYVDADLARINVPDIVSRGVEFYRKHYPDVFAVESNQFQQLLQQEFSNEFAVQGISGVYPYPIENHTNKLVRIRRLGPLLSGRRLRFCHGSSSVKLLVEQLKMFPVGDHDDGPDALEMSIRLINELTRAPVRESWSTGSHWDNPTSYNSSFFNDL